MTHEHDSTIWYGLDKGIVWGAWTADGMWQHGQFNDHDGPGACSLPCRDHMTSSLDVADNTVGTAWRLCYQQSFAVENPLEL